jgi:predicted DNA-binding antitoxin AbrB/MazE fold protein
MTTSIDAIYENGILRPLAPLALPEGQRVHVVVAADEMAGGEGSAAILAEIAAMPPEAPADPSTSRDHDKVLYGKPHQP